MTVSTGKALRNAEVAEFVAAVRRELDDLAPDEVEELTGGLEADLDDALADGGNTLGTPDDYAAELRSAAGLPPRASRGGERGAGSLLGGIGRLRRQVARQWGRVTVQPWWPGTRDFFVTLRPFWWVLRAWAAWQCLAAGAGVRGLPDGLPGWFFLALFVVVSVELGRRRMADRGPWRRRLLRTGNVLAVLLLLPALSVAGQQRYEYLSNGPDAFVPPNGLWLDGTEVRNVFPYDAQGNQLTDVQLFDENGRSLSVGDSARTPLQKDGGYGTQYVAQVPVVDANNRPQWNVYPLRQQLIQETTDPNTGATTQVPVDRPADASRPLRTTLPVSPPAAGISPSATVVPSASDASPNASGSPAPSASSSSSSSTSASSSPSPTAVPSPSRS